ncbi:fungal hydrophobin [Coprinopsis marcescibilis]|uniref:Hydrophobin n=1 Tax=Coprinopsis marcescibilis TaxID=230819 RepID=A0A5C3L6R0_COPMA|nr:fungal hydrophobin [Coprinopsis marcescibilis]
MKVAFIVTLLSLFVTFAAAIPRGINAQRMARGMSPLPPVRRRATPAHAAARAAPSNVSQCNGGTVKCCNSVASSNDSSAGLIAGLLGIALPLNSIVGLGCTTLNVIGVGGSSCSKQTVCCNGNSFGALISLGCTPISLGA